MKNAYENFIHSLADKLKLDAVSSIHQIVGKSEVSNVFLVSCQSKKYIFRLNDAGELSRFQKEAWCIAKAQKAGVPGPEVIAVGSEDEQAYMVASYLEGELADDIATSLRSVWKTLGEYCRKIHGIRVAGFGENLEDMQHDTREKWRGYLDYNIESLNDTDELLSGIITRLESDYLKDRFKQLRLTEFAFGLTHGDLSLKNVIVAPNGVPHLIDWGSAEAHIVPHHDFGVILGFSLEDTSDDFTAFLEGYGYGRADYESIKNNVWDLQLLEATDHLRWAIDKSPKSIKSRSHELQKKLRGDAREA
jgi:aminoglycoside phosphotransferase